MPKYSVKVLLPLSLLLWALAGHGRQLSFTGKPVNRVAVNSLYEYVFAAIDSLQRQVTYSVDHLPAWIKLDKKRNRLSGISNKTGQFLVQIKAATIDTAVVQSFMLTVYDKKTVNIVCLGNSITNGTSHFNSYRRPLWQLLHKGNYNIDFVGSWDKHHMGGQVPQPDFDMDHDGHSGWKAGDLLDPPDWDTARGTIRDWLKHYRPEIVLMELGTNDLFQCLPVSQAIQHLDSIVCLLRQNNPRVRILLAQVPPLGHQWASKKLCGNDVSYAEAIHNFNEAIAVFGKARNNSLSPVIIVDQFTGIDPAVDMYDDIHPNEQGEKKMAERWFAAMVKYLSKNK